jgi:hypothetical protein
MWRRSTLRWPLILAAAVFSSTACVCQEGAPVTDTELKAAYCLGVVTAQIEDHSIDLSQLKTKIKNSRTNSIGDQLSLDFEERMHKTLIERRNRVRDYLTSKGFLGRRNVQVIQTALLRGPEDVNGCFAENKNPLIAACKHKCYQNNAKQCDTQCAADACARVGRCLESYLPF